jgi:hypothetical protein
LLRRTGQRIQQIGRSTIALEQATQRTAAVSEENASAAIQLNAASGAVAEIAGSASLAQRSAPLPPPN